MHNNNLSRIVIILSPSVVLMALAMDIMIPCIPAIADYFAVSFVQAQSLLSIFFIGAGLGQIFIGVISDMIGRRVVILTSIAAFILSSMACAMAPSLRWLLVARFIEGFTACGVLVVVIAVIRDLFTHRQMGRAYSCINGIVALAPIFGPLIAGYLLLWTGNWRWCFIFMVFFGVVAWVTNFFWLRETLKHKSKRLFRNFYTVFTNYSFIVYTANATVGLLGLLLFFSISPLIMISLLKLTPVEYGYYFALNFVIYIFGNLFSMWLQNSIDGRTIVMIGNSCMLLASLLMIAWQYYIYGPSLYGLLCPAALLSFGIGMIYGPCMSLAMHAFKKFAGTAATCFVGCTYLLSGMIAIMVMSQVHEDILPYGYSMTGLVIFSLYLGYRLERSK